jgi:hypothetical protein
MNPIFDVVTQRIPVRDASLLVGCIHDGELHVRMPRRNILEDFMNILTHRYGGILAMDLNHCIYFLETQGILNLSKLFTILVFIPTRGDCIDYLYTEISKPKREEEKYESMCHHVYEMLDKWIMRYF